MKRTIFAVWGSVLVSAVLGTVTFAVPWVEEEDYDPSLLNKALNRGLNIEVSGVNSNEKMTYRKATSQAYNAWFKQSAELIAQQGREQEFGPLYNRLTQGVNTNRLGSNPDVKVVIVSPEKLKKSCGDDSQGCTLFGENPPTIYMPPLTPHDEQAWHSTLLHEVGHTLGLDEQYDRNQSHNQDVSRIRSSSERYPDSIMNNTDNRHITCDDATGLINIIDHHASGAYNRQGKEWNSLCNGSKDKYKDGKRVGAEQQTHITRDAGSNRWSIQSPGAAKRSYEVVKHGPIHSVNDVVNMPITVTKKDEQGRPLEGRDKYGAKVLYSYFQGQTNRMALLGNSLIWADQTTKRDEQTDHLVQFGHNGQVSQAFWGQLNNGDDKKIFAGYKANIYDKRQNYDSTFECPPTLSVQECMSQHLTASQPAAPHNQLANAAASGQTPRADAQARTSSPRANTSQTRSQTVTNASRAPKQDQRRNLNNGVLRPASTRPATGNIRYNGNGNQIVGVAH